MRFSLLLLGALASVIALPVLAADDQLGNPPAPGGGFVPTDVVPVTRADFGPCAINRNFDELVGGGNGCDGNHVTNQYPGLLFSVPADPADCVICANSILGGLVPNNSDPNIAYTQQNSGANPNCAAPHGQVVFNPPVLQVGMDYFTSLNSNFTLRTYTSANQLIETLQVQGALNGSFLSGFAGIKATSPVIARIEIQNRPDGNPDLPFNFMIDDFIYQYDECATPVSPATWGALKSVYGSD